MPSGVWQALEVIIRSTRAEAAARRGRELTVARRTLAVEPDHRHRRHRRRA
jgi:hypothetical protein